eukprot:TRINITY_DN8775_c0_g1_i7.p1 TRINITY_DN8775_c0_g1~~TRINITY_DN8775_c0_g1_i7.p1  ORF type:complete len:282 (+),score=59.78 TRINITY_DN8775_c0_g1_i7:113-958(+)
MLRSLVGSEMCIRDSNETGNIWTHLLAFGYALVLHERVQFSPKLLLHPHISWESAATMTAFLLSVECCFFFSVLFHTFKCRSGRASLALFQLDQLGIVLLVVVAHHTSKLSSADSGHQCSFLPGLHLGFYCEPQLAFVYTAVILTALGIGVILVLLQMQYPFWLKLQEFTRNFLIATTVFGLIPACHFVVLHGPHSDQSVFIMYLFAMFGSFGAGFFFYITKVPEKLSPGTFDRFFASHQVWHVLVALGAYCWYCGMTSYLEFQLGRARGCKVVTSPHSVY